MSRHVKKVGFVNLPEDRLDIFSSLTRHPEYRAEVVIDFDTSAYSYKLAEILQVPTSSDLNLLRRFPCHILVVPNDRPDLKVELNDYLGDPPAIVLTVDEMSSRLDLAAPGGEGAAEGPGSGWSLPLQVTTFDSPTPKTTTPPPGGRPAHPSSALFRRPEAGDSDGGLHIERIPGQERGAPRLRTSSVREDFEGLLHPTGTAPGWSMPEAGATPLVEYFNADGLAERPSSRAVEPSPESQLNAALETLNLASDKQLLLERILQIAVTAVRGDAGSIMLLDETGEFLRIAAAHGLSLEVQKGTRQRVGEGVAGSVMMEGRGRILVDRLNDPRYRDGRERARIKAALCVPIKVGPRSIGVLNVSSDSRKDAFGARDQERLEQFGGEVAIVLLKAMKISGSADRPLEPRLRAQVDNLMALKNPLPQRLQSVAEAFGKVCQSLACRIYLLDGTGRRLLPLGVHGTTSLTSAPPALPVDAGLVGWAMKRGTPEALVSGARDPDRRGLYFLPLGPDARLGLIELEGVPVREGQGEAQFHALLAVTQHLASLLLKERSTKVMERRSRQILQLSDLAVEMQTERSLDDLVDMALATAAGLFDANLAIVRLLPEGTVSLSDQEMAGSADPAALELLAFDDELGQVARQQTRPITGAGLTAALTTRLHAMGQVRWVVAAPVPGPRGVLAILTLYGMSEASVGLEADEVAVLEKFCGHLGRAIHRANRLPDDAAGQGFLPWDAFRARLSAAVDQAESSETPFTVTVFEVEGLVEAADVRGRKWLGATRAALNGYVSAQAGAEASVTRVREGRYAILAGGSVGEEWALRDRLTAGWPEAAAASGVEDLSYVPLEVECLTYLKDSRNLEEFLDMVADRFGGELEEAAS